MTTELESKLEPFEIKGSDQESKHEQLKRYLEQQLIKYLNKYIKKGFDMNPVFFSIKKTLNKHDGITEKQFDSIIKFIELEREFRGQTRNRIYNYFSPIISLSKDTVPTATLEEFISL